MKKNANKWLLLGASILLMTVIACSNSAGGGGDDNTEDPNTQTVTFKGIKVNFSNIPATAVVREVYVNGEKVSSDSNNSHVRDTEWGYPFVEAGKSYEVYAKFIDSNWATILTTDKVTIKAESGLGELGCTNKTYSIKENFLIFSSHPAVFYGSNKTALSSYTNLKANSKTRYIIEISSPVSGYQSWNWLGDGADFIYDNDFNFSEHLKSNFILSSELTFDMYCELEDATYGNYRYHIVEESNSNFSLKCYELSEIAGLYIDSSGATLEITDSDYNLTFGQPMIYSGYLWIAGTYIGFTNQTINTGTEIQYSATGNGLYFRDSGKEYILLRNITAEGSTNTYNLYFEKQDD